MRHALPGRLSEGSSPGFQKWLVLPLPHWRIPNAFGDLFDNFLAALGIPGETARTNEMYV